MGAECDTDQYMVVAKVRLAVRKQAAQTLEGVRS
jgi:hypothetical protein